MMQARSIPRYVLLSLTCLLLLPTFSFAKSSSPEPVGHLMAPRASVQWMTSAVDHERVFLTVVAPNGAVFHKEFARGSAPSFRLIPRISDEVKKQLAAARADIAETTVPVTVTGSAPTNSVFVDSAGRLGLRTATPVLDIHVATSNTLDQNCGGGVTAQTSDVADNEAHYFVRDATGGSRLPLRIRPVAPTSSIDISASGAVGVGTASPSKRLHVFENADANTIGLVNNTNASGLSAAAVTQSKADVTVTSMIAHGSGRTLTRFGQTLRGLSEVLNAAGNGLIVGTLSTKPLVHGSDHQASRLFLPHH